MVSYLRSKNNLEKIVSFNNAVMALWEIEDKYAFQGHSSFPILPEERQSATIAAANEDPKYQVIRQQVSTGVLAAMKLAHKHKIPTEFKSFPPVMVGGPIIPVNIFNSVLNDNSYKGISRQMVVDALNQTIGACEEQVKEEFFKLCNPINWVKELLLWFLRLPFMLIELTGFNVEKVEDHLFGKLFKALEIAVIILILYRLGVGGEDLKTIIKNMLVGRATNG